jgi:hypothetical protein
MDFPGKFNDGETTDGALTGGTTIEATPGNGIYRN